MRVLRAIAATTALLLLTGGMAAQESANKPAAPYPAIGAEESKADQQDSDKWSPDSNAITGVQPLTLGHAGRVHSFLQPSFSFSQAVDTNPIFSGAAVRGRDYVSYLGT